MTESQFQSKLLRALRSHPALRDAVIFKFNDRTTRGIPDFEVIMPDGRATFWELKVAPNRPTKIQAYYLAKLRWSWCVTLLNGEIWIQPQGLPLQSYFSFDAAIQRIVKRCVGD